MDEKSERDMISLSERLPEGVFDRIHQDIGKASMCWTDEAVGEIAYELCNFVADLLEAQG